MIGKTDGTSASFVSYQLNGNAEKEGNANVSDAVRGKTIGERNQEAMDAAQKRISETAAYQVDISDKGRNMLTYTSGSVAEISSLTGGWTREDELAALEKSIGHFQRLNENYRQTGSPVDPQDEQRRMEAAAANFAAGILDTSVKAGENLAAPIGQDFAQTLKTSAGTAEGTVSQSMYTPVTEIRTQHYRWTEATGIEETVSREDEIAAARTELRRDLETSITKSIEAILTPYDSYEEAFDALYGRQGVAVWSSLDEENLSRTEELRPVQGAFGALANYLNNYFEEFGAEDSFFTTLDSALDGLLDKCGENDIVNQVRRMVATSRSGNTIDTATGQFEKEVNDAIAGTYIGVTEQQDESRDKKTADGPEGQQGLTFLEAERHKAEMEGRLLDDLLGKEHDSGFESAADVLKKRAPEGKDTDFADKLRHVDERKEPTQPFAFDTESESKLTAQPRDGVVRLQAIHDAWLSISEGLVDGIAAEKEQALTASNAPHVDIFA